METKTKTIHGVEYLMTKEKINVGDLFYHAFMGHVETYKDVDYGEFDPNKLKAWKVKPIKVT